MITAFCVGFILVMRVFPVFPAFKNIVSTLTGAAIMVAATLWLRALPPGFVTLGLTALSGACAYSATLLVFNTAGCRTALRSYLLVKK
jgi:hypothetical protein